MELYSLKASMVWKHCQMGCFWNSAKVSPKYSSMVMPFIFSSGMAIISCSFFARAGLMLKSRMPSQTLPC